MLVVLAVASVAFVGFWVGFALTFGKDDTTVRQFMAGFAIFGLPTLAAAWLLVTFVKEYRRTFKP
jgi:uncharacterized membrane protein